MATLPLCSHTEGTEDTYDLENTPASFRGSHFSFLIWLKTGWKCNMKIDSWLPCALWGPLPEESSECISITSAFSSSQGSPQCTMNPLPLTFRDPGAPQVVISRFVSLSPGWGSVLTTQSLLGILSLLLCLPLPYSHTLSLSLSLSLSLKTNK